MFITNYRREGGESKELAERDQSLQSAESDKGCAGKAGNGACGQGGGLVMTVVNLGLNGLVPSQAPSVVTSGLGFSL